MTKTIFVTGGVVSSLGKGLTAASIALLLERRGLKVALQKLDPYLNVDPGTMSPFQHGEVYVTEDGAETDLDLGHYERYSNAEITQDSNYTTGKIYNTVISKERRGEYLGQTVQVIPHITDAIKDAIRSQSGDEIDVAICEIGGTVGDIESLPYLEAIRQYALDVGKGNAMFVHLTLIPYLRASGEMKTKPTQHSVQRLREIGIIPDMLICRTEHAIDDGIRKKISLFCNVEERMVIEEKDVDHTIYEVPLVLRDQGTSALIAEHLGLEVKEGDLSDWEEMVERVKNPDHEVNIAVVGKYLEVNDAYKSIWEALYHGGIANNARLNLVKLNAEEMEEDQSTLDGIDGILVPGGFGFRGIEGKIQAVQFARENKIPYFGICLGMQVAAIEFARNVCGLDDANSSEFDQDTPHAVIDLMESQEAVTEKGGTMRLGAYPCRINPDSNAYDAYGTEIVSERHRHRFEFNNAYRQPFEENGARFTGIWEEGDLVEILELPNHPWYVACQFHPEFKSKPTAAHPLFASFVRAALKHKGAEVPAAKSES